MAMDTQQNGKGNDQLITPSTPSPPAGPSSPAQEKTPDRDSRIRKTTTATPPPSSQIPPDARAREPFQLEYPATPTTSRRNASKDIPSQSQVEKASVEELRSLIKTMSDNLTEARINADSARLQHHFLVLQTNQDAERAEVERQLSRTQLDFLRGKQRVQNIKLPSISATAVQPPTPFGGISHTMRELENHCNNLEELCHQLKQEKELQAERIQSLSEHNTLLVNRIRENREHFTRIRDRSPNMYTPREVYTTPRRKTYAKYQDDTPAHGPFAALIAADQILSQETASVPSTPTRKTAQRAKGHTRGAHSLSSIQARDRGAVSDPFLGPQLMLSAPSSQVANESAMRERHDRDSTISVSDDERPSSAGEVNQSQASSLATSMLRKNPKAFEGMRASQDAEQSSNLLQSKLFGNVKKSGNDYSKLKRQYGFEDTTPKRRKIRSDEQVGLGIET